MGISLQLSASSLQDFADCPRRFQLRHVLGVHWPLPTTETVDVWEIRQQMAQDFHRLAQQYLLGIPAATLTKSVDDPDVKRWWQAFTDYALGLRSAEVLPEVGLSIPFQGHRLYARYDALALFEASGHEEIKALGRDEAAAAFVILDWKTYRRRPTRGWLASRLQTAVYPLVLAQGCQLFGIRAPSAPEEIELRYWLAEDPQNPESFLYSAGRYAADLERLEGLVADINRLLQPRQRSTLKETWPLTADMQLCRFCDYRSLCDRGSQGSDVNLAEAFDEDDLDQAMAAAPGDSADSQVAETAFWQG